MTAKRRHSQLGGPGLRAVGLLACGACLLAGCSTDLSRSFGLSRDAPDEYMVTTRAPLSMPPDFTLRPPRPGAPRPQEQSERRQAEEALVPQTALNPPSQTVNSPGEAALLQEIGPPAPSDIRQRVDQSARQEAENESFVDKLLFWRKPDTRDVVVDPQKEAQRLRENAALGQSPETGETPIIQPQRKGWLSGLF